jgi:hypothetical protein
MFTQDKLTQALTADLAPGERIIWSGRPDPTTSMVSDWPAIPFAAVWLAISGAGFHRSLTDGEKGGAAVTGVFVLIGLFILSQPIMAFVRARSTAFAITDRRLLIARKNGRTIKSILLSGIRQVERVHKRRGMTLRIPTSLVSDGDGGQKVDYLELHGLRDGEKAYRLLVDR